MMEAMRMRPGNSCLRRRNSFSIVSKGRSLMSSMFSQPITSRVSARPFSLAYLGVTFTTCASAAAARLRNGLPSCPRPAAAHPGLHNESNDPLCRTFGM